MTLHFCVPNTFSSLLGAATEQVRAEFQLSKWLPFTACHKSIATETDIETAGPRALGQGDRVEIIVLCIIGFPDSSAGKESACNTGDPGLIPGSGGSPGEGIGCPLQYFGASLVAQTIKNLSTIQETRA